MSHFFEDYGSHFLNCHQEHMLRNGASSIVPAKHSPGQVFLYDLWATASLIGGLSPKRTVPMCSVISVAYQGLPFCCRAADTKRLHLMCDTTSARQTSVCLFLTFVMRLAFLFVHFPVGFIQQCFDAGFPEQIGISIAI